MKILITGTAGRIGRAIYIRLMKGHCVVGLDRIPCSTADFCGDICDDALRKKAMAGVDVIVHAAALHAPHVGLFAEREFEQINVEATEKLMRDGINRGIKHFVFTSTTALYGYASTPDGIAGWIDERVAPQPGTIYHRTKIAAENTLQKLSAESGLPVTVLQMSRCFPEPADAMAVFRLNRGVDARDVAAAHSLAIKKRLPGFNRFIISGKTPFNKSCCHDLFHDAEPTIRKFAPGLAREFDARNWTFPTKIDRVYDSSAAQKALDWHPQHGYESVLRMLDEESAEVLPIINTASGAYTASAN